METKTAAGHLSLSFFGDLTGDLWDAYTSASKNGDINEKYQFYHTTDAACGEKFGLSGAGLALTRDFEESPLQYSGEITPAEVLAWTKTMSMSTVLTFG